MEFVRTIQVFNMIFRLPQESRLCTNLRNSPCVGAVINHQQTPSCSGQLLQTQLSLGRQTLTLKLPSHPCALAGCTRSSAR
jgi:hypothetical protein